MTHPACRGRALHRHVHHRRRAAQSAERSARVDRPAHQAFGTCAFVMLTIILLIGPLARLSPRFLPLLYNRRHFGVLTFFIALVHACSVVDWFAVQGAMGDLMAEMTGSPNYSKFIGFPIKALGLAGLSIMFLLAATSHDFWLAFLTPRVWKALHMALYLAYGVRGDACRARRHAGRPARLHSDAARRIVRARHRCCISPPPGASARHAQER